MEDKEINKNLQALLLAVEEEQLSKIKGEYLPNTHLKHKLAREAAFNLKLLKENTHYADCKFCKGLVAGFQKHTHPIYWQLLQYSLQRLDEETQEAIETHLQKAECEDCNRLVNKLSLSRIKELKEGIIALARGVAEYGLAVAFAEMRTPALIHGYIGLEPETIKEPFRIFYRTDVFTVLVREEDDQLMIYATTKEKGLKKMHLELIGKNTWVRDIELNLEGDNYVYREYLPELEEIMTYLGGNQEVLLVATPVVVAPDV